MERRGFLRATLAAASCGLWARPSRALSAAGERRRPNILFLMTDQQSASMLDCAGNRCLATPALDRLSAGGIRFERAYACNPVCVPSRFSLQTGLMPSAIGMGRNEDSPQSTVTDAMIENSLGNRFARAGYETAYGGKVHLPRRMNNLKDLGYAMISRDSRGPLAQACAQFIQAEHERPWLLFASFINPHDICYMGINAYARSRGEEPVNNLASRTCEETLDRVRSRADLERFVEEQCPPLPANFEIPPAEPECITRKYTEVRPFRAYLRQQWGPVEWRLHRWLYCRLTEMVDAHLGVVLEALRQSGQEDETLIVFTSDHGDMNAAHRLEHKSVLYEEAVRIPFLMRYPKEIPEGIVEEDHLVSNGLDLLPTLCDYAGIEPPGGLAGRSLRPLAAGGKSAAWREYLPMESQNGRAVRTKRFKYCLYDSGARREMLIDLEADPGEMRNLAGESEYAGELTRHREMLARQVDQAADKIAAPYLIGG
ncbi:MAG: sulfatase-like hydrolase/transferase [Sedimentisphaerales bacterium]|nr:sulfatase-like hydrolase/transferase [Sedimentisphaerales bacterium]